MSLPLADGLMQCGRHAEVLRSARADLPGHFDAAVLAAADVAMVRAIDQLVLRFIQPQDTLGEHVLRRFAAQVLGEPVEDAPLIDVLQRLERFGLLDPRQWMRWRALRNSLTHEYPGRLDIRAAILNEALVASDQLDARVTTLQRRAAP